MSEIKSNIDLKDEKISNDGLQFDHLCLKPDDIDYVIYHGGCPDGFGSAFSAWYYLSKKFPEKKIEYHAGSFGKVPSDLKGKCILICDFSYDLNTINRILKDCKALIILDHHKSAMKKLVTLDNKYKLFNMKYSGAYITWKFFHSDKPVPKIIQYIQDHDIWAKQMTSTDEVSAYVDTVPHTFDEFNKLMDDSYLDSTVIPLGTGMLRQNNHYISKKTKNVVVKFMEIDGMYYFVGYVNSTTLKSEIGNKIFSVRANCNFSAVYDTIDYNNGTSVSLRSTVGRTDVSNIATKFGGGGHSCASGMSILYVVNSLPGTVHDHYKLYHTLENVNIGEVAFMDDKKLKVAFVNTTHCSEELGKYLLQKRDDVVEEDSGAKQENKQEVTYIMRNRNNDKKDYDCDAAAVWNYDGKNNKTWYSVQFRKDIDFTIFSDVKKEFSKLKDYDAKDLRITFTLPGLKLLV